MVVPRSSGLAFAGVEADLLCQGWRLLPLLLRLLPLLLRLLPLLLRLLPLVLLPVVLLFSTVVVAHICSGGLFQKHNARRPAAGPTRPTPC